MSIQERATQAIEQNRARIEREKQATERKARTDAERWTRDVLMKAFDLTEEQIGPITIFPDGMSFGIPQYYGEATIDGLRFRRRNGFLYLVHDGTAHTFGGTLLGLGALLDKLGLTMPRPQTPSTHESWR